MRRFGRLSAAPSMGSGRSDEVPLFPLETCLGDADKQGPVPYGYLFCFSGIDRSPCRYPALPSGGGASMPGLRRMLIFGPPHACKFQSRFDGFPFRLPIGPRRSRLRSTVHLLRRIGTPRSACGRDHTGVVTLHEIPEFLALRRCLAILILIPSGDDGRLNPDRLAPKPAGLSLLQRRLSPSNRQQRARALTR
jgi:hypothetical protein